MDSLLPDPIEQFRVWLHDAQNHPHIGIPNTMCLSTIDLDGFPDGRMVLLKGFSKTGFVFFTNENSHKGQALAKTPKASLVFYWEVFGRQVRIQGLVETVSDEESDTYFHTRPRLSQIGALASDQSQRLDDKSSLETKMNQLEAHYQDQEIPRPAYWKGFRVIPHKIEFWIDQPYRLHDRFLYTKTEEGWNIIRLYP